MNKYQKASKGAAKTNGCGRIGWLIYRSRDFYFFALLKNKKINQKKKRNGLQTHVVERFLSDLPSVSSLSHQKCYHCTRNTDYVIIDRTKTTTTDTFYFCHLVTPQEWGESLSGCGGGLPSLPLTLSDWPRKASAGSGGVCVTVNFSENQRRQAGSARRTGGVFRGRWTSGDSHPLPSSSVVVLGKVQGAQVAEAQAHALHVEGVDLPLLALQQVLDPVRSLLLKRNQFLFDLKETQQVFMLLLDLLTVFILCTLPFIHLQVLL